MDRFSSSHSGGQPSASPSRRSNSIILIFVGLVLFVLWSWSGQDPVRADITESSAGSTIRPVSTLDLPEHDYAYAAFLAQPEEESENDDDDRYFVGIRILIHQLLWNPATRTNQSIPFLVLVTQDVKESKRARLARDGATIVPVDRISFPWIQASRERWRDVLSKLHLFDMTQYQRILFLDSDMLILRPLDGIFDDPAAQLQRNRMIQEQISPDEGPQPSEYVFAGVSGQGGPNHPWPPRKGNAANAGFVLLRPSRDLFDHYMRVASIPDKFKSNYPEQNLWIYVHRRNGNMPWQQLDPAWNVNWATINDYKNGAASLHTKWWNPGSESGLRDIALQMKWKMEGSSEARDALQIR